MWLLCGASVCARCSASIASRQRLRCRRQRARHACATPESPRNAMQRLQKLKSFLFLSRGLDKLIGSHKKLFHFTIKLTHGIAAPPHTCPAYGTRHPNCARGCAPRSASLRARISCRLWELNLHVNPACCSEKKVHNCGNQKVQNSFLQVGLLVK